MHGFFAYAAPLKHRQPPQQQFHRRDADGPQQVGHREAGQVEPQAPDDRHIDEKAQHQRSVLAGQAVELQQRRAQEDLDQPGESAREQQRR